MVFSFATRNRFWFGMIISVSTLFCSSMMPDSASRIRRWPSKWNGLVTTPTVEDAQFARDARHHRRGTGSGAAAHAPR